MDYANIAVAVLAAGQGHRFGSDKLMADLDGVPLGLHIAKTVSSLGFGWRFAVIAKGAAIAQHFSAAGFETIENSAAETGQSHSLHLAVHAAEAASAKALLITLGDMPFVSAGHIAKLVVQDGLAASHDGHQSMPPALFPRSCWPDLLHATGDSGARALLGRAKLVTAPADELRDIDVTADLLRPQA